ncbi:MAG: type II toxin-antitoxin system VapC family toxin [Campylobacterota bacterium]
MKIFLDANICLDLLDTTRSRARDSIAWYMKNKDLPDTGFYFSGDFITTIYYVLTQKQKLNASKVIQAIDALCEEVTPLYLKHVDFKAAQKSFLQDRILNDFEDLIVLHSALRNGCDLFMSNDKAVGAINTFYTIKIETPGA